MKNNNSWVTNITFRNFALKIRGTLNILKGIFLKVTFPY